MPENEYPSFFGSGSIRFTQWLEADDAWSVSYSEWIVEYFEDFQEAVEGRWLDSLQLLPPLYQQTAFQTCLEDFMAFEDEEEGNVVESFIEEFGILVPAEEAEYLSAVRGSFVSLYEVQEAVPQSHLVVVDLLRKGNPFTVQDSLISSYLSVGTAFGGRVVTVGNANRLTGAVMPFDVDARNGVIETFEDATKGILKETPKLLRKDPAQIKLAQQEVLEWFSSLLVAIWLRDQIDLGKMRPDMSTPETGEEENIFVSYGLENPGEAFALLDKSPALKRVYSDEPFWTWEDSNRAMLWFRGDFLDVATNSDERFLNLGRLLSELLGDNLGEPVDIGDPFEGEEVGEDDELDAEELAAFLANPEVHRALIEEFELHYRNLFDQEVPELGEQTPRDLVKTPEGRVEVDQWLKSLPDVEGMSLLPDYDTSWIWVELGIEDLRD